MIKKILTLGVCLVFFLVSFIPGIIWLITPDEVDSKLEKRELARAPEFPSSVDSFMAYPTQFSAYFDDHFGFRPEMSRLNKEMQFFLGDSPSDDVTIGLGGWMFLGSAKDVRRGFNNPFDNARNTKLYSNNELKEITRHLSGINDWLSKRGIKYIFFIAPNKHTIYPEYLPSYIKKSGPVSATDQLIDYIKKHTDVATIDMRKHLLNSKSIDRLYYKTGTHWNYRGANIAQEKISQAVSEWFPGDIDTTPYPETGFRMVKSGDVGLEKMAGVTIKPELLDPVPVFNNACKVDRLDDKSKGLAEQIFLCKENSLDTLIFRDSFFNALQAYIIRKFRRSTFLWEKASLDILEKHVQMSKPDVVIEEWVERALPYVPVKSKFNRIYLMNKFGSSKSIVFDSKADQESVKLSGELELRDSVSGGFKLKVLANNGFLDVSGLKLPKSQYIVELKMTSTVRSKARVYFSIAGRGGYPYSGEFSIQLQVVEGENTLYGLIENETLGGDIRLVPISKAGDVMIESLVIKAI